MTATYCFNASEIATILHGLRLIQEHLKGHGICTFGMCEHFEDFRALYNPEIDKLCERINPLDANTGDDTE